MTEFLKAHWLATAVGLIIVSLSALVVSILRIGEVTWDDAWPWILFICGVAAGFGALVVQSYAPPGPNLIERAMKIDAEPVLVISGIALTTVGTAFWFNFGDDDSGSPSDWWIVLIVLGVVLLLIGVLRTYYSESVERTSWLDFADACTRQAEEAATLARQAAVEVRAVADTAEPGPAAEVAALVDAATKKAEEAERLAARARRISRRQPKLLRRLDELALQAEEDRDFVKKRLR